MDNNPARECPLCGRDNDCAMAAERPPETCWCMSVKITAETLAALPESERGVRCLCRSCATGEGKPA